MTGQEFIGTISKSYLVSRKLTVNTNGYSIWRGVSHSISSQSEDLFALFIAEKLNDSSLEFIVDQTMTYNIPGEKSVQFRPDLAIIKNGVLTHYFDLKMDMGYKRRYFETSDFEKKGKQFKDLRSLKSEKISYKKDRKHIVKLNVSPRIKNQIVVVSDKNGGKPSNKTDMISAIGKEDWVEIYYLSGEDHPNNYLDKDPVVYGEAFEKLIGDIKDLL
ncbi:MAG: hypothetical protein ACI8Q1_002591 [Parvicella sp.]|jgi:hypothetical protein